MFQIISNFNALLNSIGRSSLKIAIDLGTANTSVYVANHGIIANQPTIVANDTKNEKVIAVGETAKQMLGRTPEYIQISKPISGGIIDDPILMEIYLRHILENSLNKAGIHQSTNFMAVLSVATNATQVDGRSLQQLILKLGGSKAYLLPQLYAAAIGAKIPFRDIKGQMLVQMGESSTEIGVFSLGKIVFTEVIPISGSKFTQNVTQTIREQFNLLIGQNSAEECKVRALSTINKNEKAASQITVRGRDLNTGLPKNVSVSQTIIHDCIAKDLIQIASAIKKCLEGLPPEIAVDIHDYGINLSGGGAMIAGVEEVISRLIETSVTVVNDPTTSTIRGCGKVVENITPNLDILQEFTV